jgi:hypothetical protein
MKKLEQEITAPNFSSSKDFCLLICSVPAFFKESYANIANF